MLYYEFSCDMDYIDWIIFMIRFPTDVICHFSKDELLRSNIIAVTWKFCQIND